MSLAGLSIRRPFFISCVVILMLVLGLIILKNLPVDLFPDVTFPTVLIETPYPGAGPSEIESEVSKVLEDELSSISGSRRSARPAVKASASSSPNSNSRLITGTLSNRFAPKSTMPDRSYLSTSISR